MQRLEGRPFTLLGVNGDADRELARKRDAELGASWRSFWNGPEGPAGEIARRWNVWGWPSLFLIDHERIVRAHWKGALEPEDLEARVLELVELVERVERAAADER